MFRISQVKLDKWCVEFGAWDGVYCSNTCHLIRDKEYKAVLIEGDKSKFSELKKIFLKVMFIKSLNISTLKVLIV